jgi:hypothetical protein
VHHGLLPGEICVLRSTMYFYSKNEVRIEERGKGEGEVERTGGERRTWRLVLVVRLIGGRLLGL